MTGKKNTESNVNEPVEEKVKTCFVIMPIADHPDYPNGHFSRVYNHLIKPACEKSGYKVVRADDAKASHMIMFDILKKIVECDMAICDLSSKNANVFYELGLRQAFNKKTILITDEITNTPFDITGFRYVKYSESLRVDTVFNNIDEISAMLTETENAKEDDINSIVNLLRIQPAKVQAIELSQQESVVYDLIKNLDAKVSSLTNNQYLPDRKSITKFTTTTRDILGLGLFTGKSFDEIAAQSANALHMYNFTDGNTVIGRYQGRDSTGNLVFINGESKFAIRDNDLARATIKAI